MGDFILVNKDDRVIAKGITDDFNPGTGESVYELIPKGTEDEEFIGINNFPDKMVFCKFVNGEIVVDSDYKDSCLADKEIKDAEVNAVITAMKTKYKDKKISEYSDEDVLAWSKTTMFTEIYRG